jgi:hypothetical protein
MKVKMRIIPKIVRSVIPIFLKVSGFIQISIVRGCYNKPLLV